MEMEEFCFVSKYQITTSLPAAEFECYKTVETTHFAKR
jgi:hypothetical protein